MGVRTWGNPPAAAAPTAAPAAKLPTFDPKVVADGQRNLNDPQSGSVAAAHQYDQTPAPAGAAPPPVHSATATNYADVGAEAQTGDVLARRDEFAQKLADYQNRIAPKAAGPGPMSATPVAHTAVGPANQLDTMGGMRPEQLSAINMLQGAAAGTAPSAAIEATKAAQARGIAAQMAMRSAARGSGMARAQGAAAQGVSQINADTEAQVAATRAAEMAQARSQYATTVGGAREQDIQGGTVNVTEGNKLLGQQAGITAGESAQTAALGTDMTKYAAGLGVDVSKFNADQQRQWAGMDDAQKKAYMDFIIQSQSQGMQGAGIHANYAATTRGQNFDLASGLAHDLIGAATGGSAAKALPGAAA